MFRERIGDVFSYEPKFSIVIHESKLRKAKQRKLKIMEEVLIKIKKVLPNLEALYEVCYLERTLIVGLVTAPIQFFNRTFKYSGSP